MDDEMSNALENSFTSEKTYELLRQSGKVAGDWIDVLSGIPVFASISAVKCIFNKLKLRRLKKKLHKFLLDISMSDTSEEEREKFIEELTNANYKKAAGKVLLEMINGFNDTHKIDVLANLVIARIKGKMDIEIFIRLCTVLERLSYLDLCALKNYDKGGCDQYSADSLLGAGMLSDAPVWIIVGEEGAENDRPYHLTPLGEKMIEYGLPESV